MAFITKKDRPLALVACIVIIAFLVLIFTTVDDPISRPSDGVAVSTQSDPEQLADSTTILDPVTIGSATYKFTVKAAYQVSGVLVSKHNYPHGAMSKLAPYDYAIAWGKTLDWLPHLKFSQASRYCFFKYKLSSPVDRSYVDKHASNNHLIPATPNLRKAFRTAKKNDLVRVDGYLVNVDETRKGKKIPTWTTSTKRDDIGMGACEIIYVTRLQINDQIFE